MTDSSRDTDPATILVVEDSETNLYLLTSWLERAGHVVIGAKDAGEGLKHLAAAEAPLPEIAIVDVRLPDMSGFELSEQIKSNARTTALPVIHISASAVSAEDHAEGLRRGADTYLNQPLDPGELLATVTATLRYARARRRAEQLARQLLTLNEATMSVYSAVGFHSFASAATSGAARLLSSPAGAVFLSPEGQAVHSTSDGPTAAVRTYAARPDVLDRLLQQSLGDGTGATVTRIARGQWQALLGTGHLGGHIAMAVARTKRGRPPVCLAVPADALTGTDDEHLLQQLAHACALALEALRTYNEEHTLALALQRSLLPSDLPAVDGVDLAFRYLPASENAEIGGDFYEAIPTGDGLLLAIGDVLGHSLGAAIVMGGLRHALRAYAIEGHPPQQVLDRLEALLAHSHPTVTASLCLVLVEAGGRRVQIANAGHIPPLLVGPDGHARFHTPHGPILGMRAPHPAPTTLATPPGTRLLLVTDGLVEVRNTSLNATLDAFMEAVTTGPAGLQDLSDHLLDTFGRGKDDDIALLAADLRGS
ncbi:SpoIIE family protein phosphatase [Streptomyces longisporoflavus]|uniref:SpoIIE family protein phosphatase n=1 Tax=Streptomyces longisporoflavus TaxID=28044 RepID=A0ABW7QPS0_9ACTN